ncbi:hypothetical protein J6590_019977 [Homalodisca vitripennis]|nr:hypothetical protein J6590_019977 [Homalodisca vitripennis]
MTGRFSAIHHYFPVHGHSFLPCDRDFATVKRAIRKFDRVYTPIQYNEIIESDKVKVPKFVVKIFKKTTKSIDKLEDFSISKYKHFEYSSERPGYVIARPFIDSIASGTFQLKKTRINKPSNRTSIPRYVTSKGQKSIGCSKNSSLCSGRPSHILSADLGLGPVHSFGGECGGKPQ